MKAKERQFQQKRFKHGTILFGRGYLLLRDMLDAGVFDCACLNGEFGDIQMSLRCCVPYAWLTFVTNSADDPLRWPIGVANLEDTNGLRLVPPLGNACA